MNTEPNIDADTAEVRSTWRVRFFRRHAITPLSLFFRTLSLVPILLMLTWHLREKGYGWIAYPMWWATIVGTVLRVIMFSCSSLNGLMARRLMDLRRYAAVPTVTSLTCLVLMFYGFLEAALLLQASERILITMVGRSESRFPTVALVEQGLWLFSIGAFAASKPWLIMLLEGLRWLYVHTGVPPRDVLMRIQGGSGNKPEISFHMMQSSGDRDLDNKLFHAVRDKDWDAAQRYRDQLSQKLPSTSAIHHSWDIRIALGQGDHKNALQLIHRYRTQDRPYQIEEIKALIGLGRITESRRIAEVVATQRKFPMPWAVCLVLQAEGRPEEALGIYDSLLRNSWQRRFVLEEASDLLTKMGRYREACECAEGLVREGAGDSLSIRKLAECYRKLDKNAAADRLLAAAGISERP